jgi:nicotinamidase/pyrazinamidase
MASEPTMRCLLLVDIQNDFLPGGALAVPGGDQVIPVANALATSFALVVATQDWHPPNHCSFAANHPGRQAGEVIELDGMQQVLWPVHCVQGTPGAELAAALDRSRIAHVVYKGTNPRIDSYSGFFDNGQQQATGLGDYLRQRGVSEVYLAGLATDYCVKFTALDARQLGFRTFLVLDGCRGVELRPGDCQRAVDEMASRGVHVVSAGDVASEAADEASGEVK